MNETTTTWHLLPEVPDTDREVLVAFKWDKVPVQAYLNKNGKWYGSSQVREQMKDGYVQDDRLNTEYMVAWCEVPEIPKEISGL